MTKETQEARQKFSVALIKIYEDCPKIQTVEEFEKEQLDKLPIIEKTRKLTEIEIIRKQVLLFETQLRKYLILDEGEEGLSATEKHYGKFTPEEIEVFDLLNLLGFQESDYGHGHIYWHFECKHGFSHDALKYYESEGICLFSGGGDLESMTIKTIEDAKKVFYHFYKDVLETSKTEDDE